MHLGKTGVGPRWMRTMSFSRGDVVLVLFPEVRQASPLGQQMGLRTDSVIMTVTKATEPQTRAAATDRSTHGTAQHTEPTLQARTALTATHHSQGFVSLPDSLSETLESPGPIESHSPHRCEFGHPPRRMLRVVESRSPTRAAGEHSTIQIAPRQQ